MRSASSTPDTANPAAAWSNERIIGRGASNRTPRSSSWVSRSRSVMSRSSCQLPAAAQLGRRVRQPGQQLVQSGCVPAGEFGVVREVLDVRARLLARRAPGQPEVGVGGDHHPHRTVQLPPGPDLHRRSVPNPRGAPSGDLDEVDDLLFGHRALGVGQPADRPVRVLEQQRLRLPTVQPIRAGPPRGAPQRSSSWTVPARTRCRPGSAAPERSGRCRQAGWPVGPAARSPWWSRAG